MYKPAPAGLIVALAFVGASLACSEWIPEYTPVAPQLTAQWSMTDMAQKTASVPSTAAYGTQTATASDTPTATGTPTSSILEVTPSAIIETGYATMPSPNEIVIEAGKYTPYGPQNVRQCANRDCPIVGSLEAYRVYNTAAWLINENREVWLCRRVLEDTHGAQLCDGAVIWIGIDQKYGRYEVVQ